jgi:hypothetical protein
MANAQWIVNSRARECVREMRHGRGGIPPDTLISPRDCVLVIFSSPAQVDVSAFLFVKSDQILPLNGRASTANCDGVSNYANHRRAALISFKTREQIYHTGTLE